jgi:hypothetical protein
MPSYEVVKSCYVPFGKGVRYRVPGQVVTLDVKQANDLDGYVRPTVGQAIPDTKVIVRNPDSVPTVRFPDNSATIDEEVVQGVGDPSADHE